MPKPDFRHMMWALLAKLQTEGRGNEFYHVLKNTLLHVLDVNLKAIAMWQMAASELRWEIYRKESIPEGTSLFPRADDEMPLPRGCLAFDIYSMQESIAAHTADEELINILWRNGCHRHRKQKRVREMLNGDDTLHFSAKDAILSIAEHITTHGLAKEHKNKAKHPKGASGQVPYRKKRGWETARATALQERHAKRMAKMAGKAEIKAEDI
ncbi:hypothetical protein F4775DRAFT_552785 [Biscogniauxia sp. FL1348]|nr:hypothetical protein F4775DRAFT_552785 [Biscogniauxia sp. FL1348]